ncbi:MAG TPA: hypothetical protein OIM50_06015 [Clostridiaceae bacterium]|jgi:hypothetical protein|nr:hypothetical protein [Clostridia bacterium]HJJ09828.1 hypothetical protein [Clostridiaceae bacterium]
MVRDSENENNKIYLSYKKILNLLNIQNIKTSMNKDIDYKILLQAIRIMEKKHPICRWRQIRAKDNKHYILIEGFYWLSFVYFQHSQKQIDADIDFFKLRISQYQKLLNIKSKNFWLREYKLVELIDYFDRSEITIKKAISKMIKYNKDYMFIRENKYFVTNEGIEWLCKNIFKQKYLEILEKYKMELTELYIKAGYPYDLFD